MSLHCGAFPGAERCLHWVAADGGNGTQLGVQILGAAAIAVFTLVLNTVGFGVLHWFGCLRVPKEVREKLHCSCLGTSCRSWTP